MKTEGISDDVLLLAWEGQLIPAIRLLRQQSGFGVATVRAWGRSLPQGATILDLACGFGVPNSQALINDGFVIYGVDASPSLIAEFRRRFPGVNVACEAVEDSRLFDRTFDGVIVAGDFNLVGSRRPLNLLTTRLDIAGLSLIEAEPYQLDGLSNATWSDRKQSFVPGRLDYLLFSHTTVALRNTFVLDTRDLTPQALHRLGLRSDDTASASDHFPVVADVRWIPSEQ